jgi:hypothetical protein
VDREIAGQLAEVGMDMLKVLVVKNQVVRHELRTRNNAVRYAWEVAEGQSGNPSDRV